MIIHALVTQCNIDRSFFALDRDDVGRSVMESIGREIKQTVGKDLDFSVYSRKWKYTWCNNRYGRAYTEQDRLKRATGLLGVQVDQRKVDSCERRIQETREEIGKNDSNIKEQRRRVADVLEKKKSIPEVGY